MTPSSYELLTVGLNIVLIMGMSVVGYVMNGLRRRFEKLEQTYDAIHKRVNSLEVSVGKLEASREAHLAEHLELGTLIREHRAEMKEELTLIRSRFDDHDRNLALSWRELAKALSDLSAKRAS